MKNNKKSIETLEIDRRMTESVQKETEFKKNFKSCEFCILNVKYKL